MKLLTAKQYKILLDKIEQLENEVVAHKFNSRKMIKKIEELSDELEMIKTPVIYPNVPNYYVSKITQKHQKTLDKWAEEETKKVEKLLHRSINGKLEIELVFKEN